MMCLKTQSHESLNMEQITNYVKNGFHYQLVERRGDWVIFRQSAKKDSTAPFGVGMAWEVFRIKVSKGGEMTVKGADGQPVVVKFEPKECPPSDESFGSGVWSCHSLLRAYEKLAEAIESEKINKERRDNSSSVWHVDCMANLRDFCFRAVPE